MKFYLTKNQYFIFSILGQLLLVFSFLGALFFPLNNTKFIFQGGVAILGLEIISLECAMIFGNFNFKIKLSRKESIRKTVKRLLNLCIILFIPSFFAIGISIGTQTIFPALLFLISIVTKIFSNRAIENSYKYSFYKSFLLLFLVAGILIPIGLTYQFWQSVFPFPQEVFQYKGNDNFADYPQTLLVWGVIYYTILILLAFYHYRKQNKK